MTAEAGQTSTINSIVNSTLNNDSASIANNTEVVFPNQFTRLDGGVSEDRKSVV